MLVKEATGLSVLNLCAAIDYNTCDSETLDSAWYAHK